MTNNGPGATSLTWETLIGHNYNQLQCNGSFGIQGQHIPSKTKKIIYIPKLQLAQPKTLLLQATNNCSTDRVMPSYSFNSLIQFIIILFQHLTEIQFLSNFTLFSNHLPFEQDIDPSFERIWKTFFQRCFNLCHVWLKLTQWF